MREKVKSGIRNEKYEIFGNIGLGGNVWLRPPLDAYVGINLPRR